MTLMLPLNNLRQRPAGPGSVCPGARRAASSPALVAAASSGLPAATSRRAFAILSYGLLALGLTALVASPARAIEVQCSDFGDADAFGWSVASGGDYDGDGKADIAVGAPCAWVTKREPEGVPDAPVVTKEKAGRVRIFSGATGRVIASLVGSDDLERYGSALAFAPDLNGDGKAELVIGASTFDAPRDGGGFRVGAGRVEVRSAKSGGTILWQVSGFNDAANLGESVAVLSDLNGDGKAEVVAGAGRGQIGGSRDGIAYVFSGVNGALLTQNDGELPEGRWASLVGYAGDINGDGTGDWLAASNIATLPKDEGVVGEGLVSTTTTELPGTTTTIDTTTTTVTTTTTLPPVIDRAGWLRVLSGKTPYGILAEYRGAEAMHRLGRSAAATTDFDSDGISDLWIGLSGVPSGSQAEAGAIDLFNGSGVRIRRIREPAPQSFAAFGTAIAVPGSLDGGTGKDVVAGAPMAKVSDRTLVGRVHAFDAATGNLLWSQDGLLATPGPGARFGNSLASGLDFDSDGVSDVVVGAPGATPNGRRGAGAAYVLSGKNGKFLATFHGRRGRETHLFVSGPGLDRRPVIRNFDPFGRRREAEIRPYTGQPVQALSMALIDATSRTTRPLLVVGAGKGGVSPTFTVYQANRRRVRVTSPFVAGAAGYIGGLNVAGGNFATQSGQEIAVAPADDVTGTADIHLYRRFATDPFGRIQWTKAREVNSFPAFRPTDTVDGTPVNAVGVNLAGGNLSEAVLDEIVVAPAAGLPVVKVLNSLTGATISQWQAYLTTGEDSTENSGTAIAVANLRGNESRQILTAPARGQLWIRAWNLNGTPFPLVAGGPDVSIFVPQNIFGPTFVGGLTITAADVDFDGADEIIVAPGAGTVARILAFEADGTQVAGWSTMRFLPYGPLATGGLSLLGMNEFWKP